MISNVKHDPCLCLSGTWREMRRTCPDSFISKHKAHTVLICSDLSLARTTFTSILDRLEDKMADVIRVKQNASRKRDIVLISLCLSWSVVLDTIYTTWNLSNTLYQSFTVCGEIDAIYIYYTYH